VAPWVAGLEENHAEFLVWDEKEQVRVYNAWGQEAFRGKAEGFSALGDEYLVVERSGKKQLHSQQGKLLSTLKLDAAGNYTEGMISLLVDKKFGAFSWRDTVQIAPKYNRNIWKYSSKLFVASRESGYGWVNKQGKELTPFEFEEIKYWNDSVALVRKGSSWWLYHLYQNRIDSDQILSLQFLRQDDTERIALVLRDTGYGIISSTKGEVVSPVYSEIINLGTPDVPLYFAEKHIDEADFFVVIYYDADGKIILRQAFELKEYERVFCDR
jgi:hypothetical protein